MGRIAGVTPEETRTRLIQAAVQVFADRGYEGARVTDIARDAGLSSGAIYAHYRSKAELLVDAIRAHGPDEVGKLLTSGDREMPLPDLLVTLGSTLEHRDPTQGLLLIEAAAAARRDPDLAKVLAASLADRERLMGGLVRQGQRAGDVDGDVAPDVLARFCLLVLLGSLLARVLDLPPTDRSEWSRFITRLVDSLRTGESP